MYPYNEMDDLVTLFMTESPNLPEQFLGIRYENKKKFFRNITIPIYYCKRCKALLTNNYHVCNDIFYYAWNMIISERK